VLPISSLRALWRLFGPDVQDLFDPQSSLGIADGWRGRTALGVGVGLAAYSILVARHAWGSAVFLGVAGALLVVTAFALQRAALSLFTDEAPALPGVATGRRRKELEREKAALLKALKELEFDHEMNKVSDADYAEIGGVYRARAIRVIRQLDETKVDYAALIEAELAKKRGGKPAPIEAPKVERASNACPQCATVNDADAVFCKKCAFKLGEREQGSVA